MIDPDLFDLVDPYPEFEEDRALLVTTLTSIGQDPVDLWRFATDQLRHTPEYLYASVSEVAKKAMLTLLALIDKYLS